MKTLFTLNLIFISTDNTNGASTCTNLHLLKRQSNGLILNSLELDPQRDHLYPIFKNSLP